MTKLYGVSCCHHPCHYLCWWAIVCVIISCIWWLSSLSSWMDYFWRLDRIKLIVVNEWWRGMLHCYLWLCWYVQRNRLACWMMMMVDCQPPCWICCHVHVRVRVHLFRPGYLLHLDSKIYVRLGDAVDYSIILGGPPTLPDTNLIQSVRNQAYFNIRQILLTFSRVNTADTSKFTKCTKSISLTLKIISQLSPAVSSRKNTSRW